MDIGSRRGAPVSPLSPAQRPDAPLAASARPDLPPDRAVQPGGKPDAARPEGEDRGRAAREGLAAASAMRLRERLSRIHRDERADEWVFSKVDAETGEVLSQFPDEATLRRRAFLEGLRKADNDGAGDRHLVAKVV
jgi:hypothetical protein